MAPQDMWVHRGMTLIASCRDATTLLNGCTYDVEEIDDAKAVVRLSKIFWPARKNEDGTYVEPTVLEEPPSKTLALKDVSKLLRLQYALTYSSVQGRTISVPLLLLDLHHRYLTVRHLMVSVSRVTEGRLLACATREQQRAFVQG